MAMKGQDLYEALSRVDPAMLEAAAEPPRQQRAWRRPAVIAACAALLLAGTAVAVFCGVEIRILDVEDPETYMPYRVKLPTEADAAFQVEGQVETTPVEAFSPQLLEDAAAGERYHTFDTWKEAMAYAGVEASGPEGQTDVTVTLENGKVAQVSLSAGGSSAGFDDQNTPAVSTYTASFYTEHCTEDRGNRYFFYDLEVIEQETITVAGGETAQIISTQSQQGGGMVCGFLARGQVLYSVDVLYLPGQVELAKETLVTALNSI